MQEKYEPVLPLKNKDEVQKIYCEQLDMEAACEVERDLSQAKNIAEA